MARLPSHHVGLSAVGGLVDRFDPGELSADLNQLSFHVGEGLNRPPPPGPCAGVSSAIESELVGVVDSSEAKWHCNPLSHSQLTAASSWIVAGSAASHSSLDQLAGEARADSTEIARYPFATMRRRRCRRPARDGLDAFESLRTGVQSNGSASIAELIRGLTTQTLHNASQNLTFLVGCEWSGGCLAWVPSSAGERLREGACDRLHDVPVVTGNCRAVQRRLGHRRLGSHRRT